MKRVSALHEWCGSKRYRLDQAELLFEAWERMTYGGVTVVNEPDLAGENMYPEYIPPYVSKSPIPREDWR